VHGTLASRRMVRAHDSLYALAKMQIRVDSPMSWVLSVANACRNLASHLMLSLLRVARGIVRTESCRSGSVCASSSRHDTFQW
jgi:hypothetical protein